MSLLIVAHSAIQKLLSNRLVLGKPTVFQDEEATVSENNTKIDDPPPPPFNVGWELVGRPPRRPRRSPSGLCTPKQAQRARADTEVNIERGVGGWGWPRYLQNLGHDFFSDVFFSFCFAKFYFFGFKI